MVVLLMVKKLCELNGRWETKFKKYFLSDMQILEGIFSKDGQLSTFDFRLIENGSVRLLIRLILKSAKWIKFPIDTWICENGSLIV
jgi:hypothetical protein